MNGPNQRERMPPLRGWGGGAGGGDWSGGEAADFGSGASSRALASIITAIMARAAWR